MLAYLKMANVIYDLGQPTNVSSIEQFVVLKKNYKNKMVKKN